MKVALILITLALLASGCAPTYTASRYSISADSVVALRSHSGKSVNVGPFTAASPGQTEITCRAAGPVKTQDGEAFSEFVRKALLDELRIASMFSATAPVTLTGNLDAIDFDSMAGSWNLALTVKSSNGKSMMVSETYRYETSFAALVACRATAQAFVPAVQNLVGKLVSSSGFAGLVSQ